MHGPGAHRHADADDDTPRDLSREIVTGSASPSVTRRMFRGMASDARPARGAGSPLIIAHRGASAHAAGNSVEAFERAIAAGADCIEFDVRRTREHELIVFHDARVAGAPVATLTRADIARRRRRVPPLLSEVLELAAGRVRIDVELKEDGYVERVVDLIGERFAAPEVIITSFLDEVVARVKDVEPTIRTGLLLGIDRPSHHVRTRLSELRPVARAEACRADYVAPHQALVRFGTLARAAAAGLPALVWTVNRRELLRELIGDPRVAGIITDVPARAVELRREANQPAPRS